MSAAIPTYVHPDAVLGKALLLDGVGGLVSVDLLAVLVPLGGVQRLAAELEQTRQVRVLAATNVARDAHLVDVQGPRR